MIARASGPTVPPGATLGSVVTSGTIPGTSSGGVLVSGLIAGNWYAIESSGGPVNVFHGTGQNTCTIAIRDGAGGPWYSRDSWTASTWVSDHDNIGPCPSEVSNWYSYSRFWFVANSTSLYVRVYDGQWWDNIGSLDFTVYNLALSDTLPPVTSAVIDCLPGLAAWCVSSATVTLTASDPGVPASGIQTTFFNETAFGAPVVITDEGVTGFTYYSIDNAGNVETAQAGVVMLDTLSPSTFCSPTGLQGTNGWFISSVEFICTSTDLTSGVASTTVDGVSYMGPVSISQPGMSTHPFYSQDNAGNTETTQTSTIQIDTELPDGSLNSPASGQLVRGTISLSGGASDTVSGIEHVRVSTDDGSTWHDAAISAGTWSYELDTTGIDDGLLSIFTTVRDTAGNEQTVAPADLTIDNTPPALSLTSTHTDLCIGCSQGSSIELNYSVSDNLAGIADWTLAVDGGPTLAQGLGETSSSLAWEGSSFGPGQYVLRLSAIDVAGNTHDTTLSVTLYTQSAPPTASIEVECLLPGDHDWCRMPVKVRVRGYESGSPISRLEVLQDNQPQVFSGAFGLIENGINGSHTISLTAVDGDGRRSDTVHQSFKVDSSPPVIQFGGFGENGLSITVADEIAGVARWTVQIFDSEGQSAFYIEGGEPFQGEIPWFAGPGIYQIELFGRDLASNESHLPRTAFAIVAPDPTSIFEQILGSALPSPTRTVPPPATQTPLPVSVTPQTTRQIAATEASHLGPRIISEVTTPVPTPISETVDVVTTTPFPFLNWLALSALALLLWLWALSAALDRRASAISSAAAQLGAIFEMRLLHKERF